MPKNNSFPNSQFNNWIFNFNNTHPRPPIYFFSTLATYVSYFALEKNDGASSSSTLVLQGNFDVVNLPETTVKTYFVDAYNMTTEITEATFDFQTNTLTVPLDMAVYGQMNQIRLNVLVSQKVGGTSLDKLYIGIYSKTYTPVVYELP